jgi:hypothetical protein
MFTWTKAVLLVSSTQPQSQFQIVSLQTLWVQKQPTVNLSIPRHSHSGHDSVFKKILDPKAKSGGATAITQNFKPALTWLTHYPNSLLSRIGSRIWWLSRYSYALRRCSIVAAPKFVWLSRSTIHPSPFAVYCNHPHHCHTCLIAMLYVAVASADRHYCQT